jgi:hypothetical protein
MTARLLFCPIIIILQLFFWLHPAWSEAQAGPTGNDLGKPATRLLAIHLSVPYLDRAVSPTAAAIRAVQQYEPRVARDDRGQVVARDHRYAQAVVRAQNKVAKLASFSAKLINFSNASPLAKVA